MKKRHSFIVSLLKTKSGSYFSVGANLSAQHGDIRGAIKDLERAAELEPGKAPIHFNLGRAFEMLGPIDQAIMHYRRALALAKEQHNDALATSAMERIRFLQADIPSRK
jgi:tetratricopeptide (TPR) repeat protein